MKGMAFLACLVLIFGLVSNGQMEKDSSLIREYKVLAKLVSMGEGSKIYIAKFKIIDVLSDTSFSDTINVGYYFYTENSNQLDTVLLTLNKYEGQTEVKNYFICPGYNAKIGIQSARINFMDLKYWERGETGKGSYCPLTFIRTPREKIAYLIMPKVGTGTTITVSCPGSTFSQKKLVFAGNCQPFLELTELKDGHYLANMLVRGRVRSLEFNLKTVQIEDAANHK